MRTAGAASHCEGHKCEGHNGVRGVQCSVRSRGWFVVQITLHHKYASCLHPGYFWVPWNSQSELCCQPGLTWAGRAEERCLCFSSSPAGCHGFPWLPPLQGHPCPQRGNCSAYHWGKKEDDWKDIYTTSLWYSSLLNYYSYYTVHYYTIAFYYRLLIFSYNFILILPAFLKNSTFSNAWSIRKSTLEQNH